MATHPATTQLPSHMKTQPTTDEDILRWIPLKMAAEWNHGDAQGFTSAFADDADFIIFDGTHLQGREKIRRFHQQIFDTLVKGTRLEAEVEFIRFITSELAVIHSRARMAFRGQPRTSPSRDSMQLLVVTRNDGRWTVRVMQNSRILPIEHQPFWDDFNSLAREVQQKVAEVTSSLKPDGA